MNEIDIEMGIKTEGVNKEIMKDIGEEEFQIPRIWKTQKQHRIVYRTGRVHWILEALMDLAL